MSFYSGISAHYRKIFPLNPVQARFVEARVSNQPESSLLDIGCGTGDLSIELSKSFKKVVGIDLDQAMLAAARKESKFIKNLEFLHLNMMEIEKRFGPDSFDCILCFGNTLVHLRHKSEVLDFLRQSSNLLAEGGTLLLQIINYDRILDKKITSLPTIETEEIIFSRNYHLQEKQHRIDFETNLTIKSTGDQIKNQIPLFPIRKNELLSVLSDAGFTSIQCYGSFQGEPFFPESIPLVVQANA